VALSVPALNRWFDRTEVPSAGLAGLDGLRFILRTGMIGAR
jgi:hypothetical protein